MAPSLCFFVIHLNTDAPDVDHVLSAGGINDRRWWDKEQGVFQLKTLQLYGIKLQHPGNTELLRCLLHLEHFYSDYERVGQPNLQHIAHGLDRLSFPTVDLSHKGPPAELMEEVVEIRAERGSASTLLPLGNTQRTVAIGFRRSRSSDFGSTLKGYSYSGRSVSPHVHVLFL